MYKLCFKMFVESVKFCRKHDEEIRKMNLLVTDIISNEKALYQAFIGEYDK